MSANDPLTSNINALITLANLATGEVDTNLSDAVHTLIDGYGQGGGGSNVVVGTFTGTTAGELLRVNTGYTGDGYPIAFIFAPTGGLSQNTVFDQTLARYATCVYAGFKLYVDTEPLYSSDVADGNKFSVVVVQKSSSSDPSAANSTNVSKDTVILDNVSETLNTALKSIAFRSNNQFDALIRSTKYGFIANIEYTYAVVYSEPNGSGRSSWIKVCEKTYENISTTSTSAVMVEEWNTGHPEIWTSDKIVCVIATDTAGKRNGYFYQSYTFFYNQLVYNDSFLTDLSSCHHLSLSYNDDVYNATLSSNAVIYGLSADKIYSTGNIRIMEKYNTTGSRTVDGNYKVEVFLLDTPSGLPLFGSDTNTGGDSSGGNNGGNSGLTLTWYDPEVV